MLNIYFLFNKNQTIKIQKISFKRQHHLVVPIHNLTDPYHQFQARKLKYISNTSSGV